MVTRAGTNATNAARRLAAHLARVSDAELPAVVALLSADEHAALRRLVGVADAVALDALLGALPALDWFDSPDYSALAAELSAAYDADLSALLRDAGAADAGELDP